MNDEDKIFSDYLKESMKGFDLETKEQEEKLKNTLSYSCYKLRRALSEMSNKIALHMKGVRKVSIPMLFTSDTILLDEESKFQGMLNCDKDGRIVQTKTGSEEVPGKEDK